MIKDQISFNQYYLTVLVSLIAFSLSANAQTTIISSPYSTTVNLGTAVTSTPRVTCVDISYDLYQGLSDSVTDTSIIKLQKYLVVKGYLLAAPNGYFGLGTLSAVKKFQVANGISSTGRVGPITRQLIRNTTCGSISITASVTNSLPSTKVNTVNSQNMTVSSPSAGMVLRAENKSPIEWKNIPNAIYDIKLEDKNGLGYGFISSSATGNNFSWEVGKVYSSKTNSEIYVEPGEYRILLTSSNYRSEIPDQYSGLFSIVGKPIDISTVIPNLIHSNIDNSIAIFGSGFNDTTQVVYRNDDIKRISKPLFISSDGKMLVFKIPSQIRASQYLVNVYNTYASGATSTPSNAVNLTIKE
jgi:peptidoglycan hydrolase-like protein with peptidoglycan-binding domain